MLRSWARVGQRHVLCDVARTSAEQARGLQQREALRIGESMLFPFPEPRDARFWMGTVSFPIDLGFVQRSASGQLSFGKIVRNAQPGTDARWSAKRCVAVVEVRAGDLSMTQAGDPIDMPMTPADFARFQDRQLIDDASPDAVDGPMPGYVQQLGTDPKAPSDITTIDPNAPSIMRLGGRSAQWQLGGEDEIAVASAVATGININWSPDRLNGGATQQAQLSPEALQSFLAPALITGEEQAMVSSLVSSSSFMTLLGDAIILAGRADLAKVGPRGLSLWKGAQ